MDSEVADHNDNGEHEHIPPDSSADLHECNQFSSINSPDLAPPHSFNGDLQHHLPFPEPAASNHADLQHHLPFPEPAASNHADLSAEINRSIADNQVLVDEIASLRDSRAAMEHTRELLQRELLGSSERAETLTAEIASLEVEKRKHQDLAACMAQEIHALHAENMDLLAENKNTASEAKSLDAILTETKEKSSLLSRDVDEKQAAMVAAQTRVHMICFEVEKLQLEKEEYSKEVSLLDASNGTINTQVSQLREDEKAVTNEVDQIVAAKSLTEQKVSDAQASIAALNVQVFTRTKSNEDMQNKLCEAKERLRQLEEQDKAMTLKERDMETSIVKLGNRIYTVNANFDTAEQAQDQEKEVNSRALAVTHVKAAAIERDLHVLELPSDVKQQYVQDLQCQVSNLREENETLACSNEELKADLRNPQEESEAEDFIPLKEHIQRLEGTLNEAEEKAHLSELQEIELKRKLQELTILARRKPRLADLATPLVISGGTIVALGLLVYFLRSNSKSK